ncbi:MAG: hypothetical protein IJU35_08300 [Paludibacteraceae bacterium]|nr:hypothetical protein [Paludibacteraceae bacterium]
MRFQAQNSRTAAFCGAQRQPVRSPTAAVRRSAAAALLPFSSAPAAAGGRYMQHGRSGYHLPQTGKKRNTTGFSVKNGIFSAGAKKKRDGRTAAPLPYT